jgi:hypothetical protein
MKMGKIEDMIARALELDEGFGGDFQGLTGEWQGLADGATAKIQQLEELNESLEAQIRELKAKNYDAMMSMPIEGEGAEPEGEAEPEGDDADIFEEEEEE